MPSVVAVILEPFYQKLTEDERDEALLTMRVAVANARGEALDHIQARWNRVSTSDAQNLDTICVYVHYSVPLVEALKDPEKVDRESGRLKAAVESALNNNRSLPAGLYAVWGMPAIGAKYNQIVVG